MPVPTFNFGQARRLLAYLVSMIEILLLNYVTFIRPRRVTAGRSDHSTTDIVALVRAVLPFNVAQTLFTYYSILRYAR